MNTHGNPDPPMPPGYGENQPPNGGTPPAPVPTQVPTPAPAPTPKVSPPVVVPPKPEPLITPPAPAVPPTPSPTPTSSAADKMVSEILKKMTDMSVKIEEATNKQSSSAQIQSEAFKTLADKIHANSAASNSMVTSVTDSMKAAMKTVSETAASTNATLGTVGNQVNIMSRSITDSTETNKKVAEAIDRFTKATTAPAPTLPPSAPPLPAGPAPAPTTTTSTPPSTPARSWWNNWVVWSLVGLFLITLLGLMGVGIGWYLCTRGTHAAPVLRSAAAEAIPAAPVVRRDLLPTNPPISSRGLGTAQANHGNMSVRMGDGNKETYIASGNLTVFNGGTPLQQSQGKQNSNSGPPGTPNTVLVLPGNEGGANEKTNVILHPGDILEASVRPGWIFKIDCDESNVRDEWFREDGQWKRGGENVHVTGSIDRVNLRLASGVDRAVLFTFTAIRKQ